MLMLMKRSKTDQPSAAVLSHARWQTCRTLLLGSLSFLLQQQPSFLLLPFSSGRPITFFLGGLKSGRSGQSDLLPSPFLTMRNQSERNKRAAPALDTIAEVVILNYPDDLQNLDDALNITSLPVCISK